MRTLKQYTNFSQAGLAKTLLEDYEVFCDLFDQYTHAIGWYLVVPVRLTVADRQLERAARILAYADALPVPSDDKVPADGRLAVRKFAEAVFGDDLQEDDFEPIENNNPWEILAIAYLFMVPGIGFLLEHLPLLLYTGRPRRNPYLLISPLAQHLLGTMLIGIAIFLVTFYFYARREITRDASPRSAS